MMGRELSQLRLVSCHLGGGCSVTAVCGGVAVATTTGYSPLEGLMMGTRCGSIDPGILLHLQRQHGLTHKELDHALNHRSGLLGVSGLSPNLAQIEVAAAQGNKRARLAFEMFADQVRGAIGRFAATLGGIDALTFTDRVGEGSATLRAAVCEGLDFMGLRLDGKRNSEARPDADIAAGDSPARIMVIHTEEELMVARETLRVAWRLRQGRG
jgi:acetate kinase